MSEKQNQETKRHRGKNFTASDDRNICNAWLAISNDPLKGRDQQNDVFWKDVQEHAKVKNRSWNAVRQRWGQISRIVTKFEESYDSVLRNQTGQLRAEDIYDEAVKLYLATTNARSWKFCECWEILRNNPKFIHYHEMKSAASNGGPSTFTLQASSIADLESYDIESNAGGTCFGDVNSTSEISVACDAENGYDQPNDWKESKFYQNDLERRRVEALESLAKAAERKNELIAEHTRAMNAATDAKLITTSGENLDSLSLQILELKKIKILMELQNADTKFSK